MALATAAAATMAMPVSQTSPGAFVCSMKLTTRLTTVHAKSSNRVEIIASSKAMTGLTAVALTAALVIPEMAEAAQPGISPSLKNFLLSIVAGGVVLVVIVGAVVAVANFDPVKRS
ncbi:hypothetical protein J5N97_005878 [Dioscorea zingiberensis]|uniref:Photosystem II reaction center X protein n=1 Tax=Dioscorea zingiberensis TaxID=325984 RepID=A0A9D5DBF5_9LILI|nr:hypothetical protein J5N97_005878 [Dioscorea zingiberensis]